MTDSSEPSMSPGPLAPFDTSVPPAPSAPPDPQAPAQEPAPPLPTPAVPSVRALLGAAFELLLRSSHDVRRASFYIGALTLATVGPAVLLTWLTVVLVPTADPIAIDAAGRLQMGRFAGMQGFLVILYPIAFAGLVAASIECRTMAMAVLGGRLAGRPIGTAQALARGRAVFWPATAVSIVVGLVLTVADAVANGLLGAVRLPVQGLSPLTATVVAATVGAPFAYVLAGIVLGGVGVSESLRRSVRVAGARQSAAVVVAAFEVVSGWLLVFGLGVGSDLLVRVAGVIGLGPSADPLSLVATSVLLLAGVFAVGTLLCTVAAITLAPQAVMFVSLTHATIGLDGVRQEPGGGPGDGRAAPRPRSLWLTPALVVAVVVAGLALVFGLTSLAA